MKLSMNVTRRLKTLSVISKPLTPELRNPLVGEPLRVQILPKVK